MVGRIDINSCWMVFFSLALILFHFPVFIILKFSLFSAKHCCNSIDFWAQTLTMNWTWLWNCGLDFFFLAILQRKVFSEHLKIDISSIILRIVIVIDPNCSQVNVAFAIQFIRSFNLRKKNEKIEIPRAVFAPLFNVENMQFQLAIYFAVGNFRIWENWHGIVSFESQKSIGIIQCFPHLTCCPFVFHFMFINAPIKNPFKFFVENIFFSFQC